MRRLCAFYCSLMLLCWVSEAQTSKRGGIFFRIDDNQPVQKWREYASVMNAYGYKFGFALNLGLLKDNKEYYQLIRDLQASGHEFQDHTPNHHTMYFTASNASEYARRSGVDHVNRDKICLKLQPINSGVTNFGKGKADIAGQTLISKESGAFQILKGVILYSRIFLPESNEIFGFSTVYADNEADPDTLILRSNWDETVSLLPRTNIQFEILSNHEIDVTDDGVQLLAQHTLDLCVKNNILRPKVWAQPGGLHSVLSRSQVKRVLGDILGYTTGGVARDPVYKVFNLSHQFSDAEFGLNWGDFQDYKTYFFTLKTQIADRIARHHILGGSNHFVDLNVSWQDYLLRLDSLLAWCKKNNIRVKTQEEWAQILYASPVDPFENIIPPLSIDLDENGLPDGYYFQPGYVVGELQKTAGPDTVNHHHIVVTQPGIACEIRELAAVEKGENHFSIWVQGYAGNTVQVKFSFPELNISRTFSFITTNSEWTQFNLDQSINGNTQLTVPEEATFVTINVVCPAIKNGPVKIGRMELKKKVTEPLKIISFPALKVGLAKYYEYPIKYFAADTTESVTIKTPIIPSWLSLKNGNTLFGISPDSEANYPVSIVAVNKVGEADTQKFSITSKHLSKFSFNVNVIDFGRRFQFSPLDTSIQVANIGEDSIIVSRLTFSSQNISLSLPGIIMPNEVKNVPIAYIPGSSGAFEEKIIVNVKQGVDIADTLIIKGFTDSVNMLGGTAFSPDKFELSQNYPNPFNSETILNYAIKNESYITLRLLNILGQTIKTIESKKRSVAGSYRIRWTGENDFGQVTGSGVYFCTIMAEPVDGSPMFQKTIKLILIR